MSSYFTPDRRGFLKLGFGSAFGLLAARYAPALPGDPKKKDETACIILWMRGGASQLDTFDPKPNHRNGGGIKTIKTRTPGLLFSASLPQLADRSKDLHVIRSLTSTEGDHNRATYFVKTGRKPLAAMRHPAFGAIAATAGPAGVLPPFIRLGPSSTPGQAYLPSQYAPFLVNGTNQRIRDLDPPAYLSPHRQKRRAKLLEDLDKSFEKQAGTDLTEPRKVAMDKARQFRGRPERAAFDLSKESKMLRQKYGQGFGQGCLMARRLIEHGVRCVEVEMGGWDTHQNNALRAGGLARSLDQGFATLLDDLKARGRLDSTLILCLSEFGRTPRINKTEGRDHYPRAFSAVLAGRGIRPGKVFGSTSPNGMSVDKPVTIPELFSTCTKALGLDPSQEFIAGDRPMKISDAPVRKELLS